MTYGQGWLIVGAVFTLNGGFWDTMLGVAVMALGWYFVWIEKGWDRK